MNRFPTADVKTSQTHWLKTAHIFYPTRLEVRSPTWVSLAKVETSTAQRPSWILQGRPCVLPFPTFLNNPHSLAGGPSLHLRSRQPGPMAFLPSEHSETDSLPPAPLFSLLLIRLEPPGQSRTTSHLKASRLAAFVPPVPLAPLAGHITVTGDSDMGTQCGALLAATAGAWGLARGVYGEATTGGGVGRSAKRQLINRHC